MRRVGVLLALVVVATVVTVVEAGCAPSLWERRPAVDPGRLHVPRAFAPLRPGSIYPDRRRPVPATGRPGVVLAGPVDALVPLGQRGMVVLLLARTDLPALERAAAALKRRPEAGGPIGLVLHGATPDLARSAAASGLFDAVVLAGLAPSGEGTPVRVPVLVLGRAGDDGPPPGFTQRASRALGGAPLERWYRASAAWPREAWRDAAEWLAGVLGARGPVA